MQKYIKPLLGAIGTIGTYLVYLLGGWDAALTIMFLLMGLDCLTGLLRPLRARATKRRAGAFALRLRLRASAKK